MFDMISSTGWMYQDVLFSIIQVMHHRLYCLHRMRPTYLSEMCRLAVVTCDQQTMDS